MSMRITHGCLSLPAVFVLVILASTGVFSQNPPTAPKQAQSGDQGCPGASAPAHKIRYPVKDGMNWYPQLKEIALGQEQSRQFEQTVKLIEDRAVLDYVDAIAQNLKCNSVTKFPLSFKV